MVIRVQAPHTRIVAAALLGFAMLAFPLSPANADQKVGLAVGKPLKEAQDLVKQNNFKGALAKTKEAAAQPGKSAYESFVVNEFLAYIEIQLKDYGAAAEAYEADLSSSFVPLKDRTGRLKTLARLEYAARDYGKAAKYARAYTQEAGPDPELETLVVQALYLQGDYKGAEAEAQSLVDAAAASGRKPEKTLLDLWLSSAFKLKDDAGRRKALLVLAADYPSADVWTDLLNLTERATGHSDKLSMEVFRLRAAAGHLSSSDDYMDMAQIAIQLGLPGEAQSIMEKGFASGALGHANKSREMRLLNMAKTQATADKASLPGSAGKPAEAAALGEAYASYGNYAKAVALYRQALAGGGLKDADFVRLHLGQALLAQGNKSAALKAFDAAQGKDLRKISEVWALLADTKS